MSAMSRNLAGRWREMRRQQATSEVCGDPAIRPHDGEFGGNVNPVGPHSCYDEGKRGAQSKLSDNP